VLNAAAAVGRTFVPNSAARTTICASETSVRPGMAARQSPAGNAVSFATQTSTLSPTPRSV
jgi:hypothetical protein